MGPLGYSPLADCFGRFLRYRRDLLLGLFRVAHFVLDVLAKLTRGSC